MTDKQVFPGFMKVLLRSIEFICVICYKINCTALEPDCSTTARHTRTAIFLTTYERFLGEFMQLYGLSWNCYTLQCYDTQHEKQGGHLMLFESETTNFTKLEHQEWFNFAAFLLSKSDTSAFWRVFRICPRMLCLAFWFYIFNSYFNFFGEMKFTKFCNQSKRIAAIRSRNHQ